MDEETKKEASKTDRINALEILLIKLDCRFDDFVERSDRCWVVHDDRSVEKWGGTSERLGKVEKGIDDLGRKIYALELLIVGKLGQLDCKKNKETMDWLKVFIGGSYFCIMLLLTAISKGWIG